MRKKLNNKGFTLIEILVCIGVLSLITIAFFTFIGSTFSITNEKAYEAFKKGIIVQVNNYIYECDNELLDCGGDYTWIKEEDYKKTSFNLSVMKKYSYFSEEEYINPITNNDVSDCLTIVVKKDINASIKVLLDDNDCS